MTTGRSTSNSLAPDSALSRDNAVAAAEHPQHNRAAAAAAGGPSNHSPRYVLAATFASAGLGNAISACCTNPADIIKVRQQLVKDKRRANFFSVGREMVRSEGFRSLYNGVTASCLRELTYSTVRFGLYETFKDFYSGLLGVSDSSFALKALSGISSGAIGSAFACPTDLLKGKITAAALRRKHQLISSSLVLSVRMQAARPDGRPPYRNTFVGFAHVYREGSQPVQPTDPSVPRRTGGVVGGIRSLYRGVGPTIIRAAVLTSSQIGSYDQVKSMTKNAGLLDEGLPLHFGASMVAGLFCSITSAPFDTVKVRLMQDKNREFKNAIDCLGKLVRNEGVLALYKG